MSRYFFHVRDGERILDHVGRELAGLREAQLIAIRLAANLLEDSALLWDGHDWSMDVANEDAETLFTLRFNASDLPALRAVKADRPR